jgi:hypothetical protein
MNCYVHPEIPAVGVCASCGRGVCEGCAVKLDGRLYCKLDVESTHSSGGSLGKKSPSNWHPTIRAATYFFGMFGVVALFTGVLLVAVGTALGTQPSLSGFPIVSQMESAATVVSILVGVFFIFLSALDFLAANWLGHSNAKGGTVGMVLSIGWTMAFIGFSALPGGAAFGVAGIVVNLFVIFLLITGWKDLD